MDSMNTKSIILGIVVLLVIIIVIVFVTIQPKEKNINSSNTVEFPIDSEEEAIAYAKTDSDVKDFINTWSQQGFEIYTEVFFEGKDDVWTVSFVTIDVTDTGIGIQFNSNGNIINKDMGPES